MKNELIDFIIENADECELLSAWNELFPEEGVYNVEDIDELFYGKKPLEILSIFVNGEKFSDTQDYFTINAYGHAESSNYIEDLIDKEMIADEINNNIYAIDYIDGLEDLINNYDDIINNMDIENSFDIIFKTINEKINNLENEHNAINYEIIKARKYEKNEFLSEIVEAIHNSELEKVYEIINENLEKYGLKEISINNKER